MKSIIILIVILTSIFFMSCENKSNENNVNVPATNNQQENTSTEKSNENAGKQNEPPEKSKKQNENSIPTSVLIDAPLISQFPELKNGCEVTSLTMMLNYAGIKVDKMTLANKIPKDATAVTYDKNGKIVKWGDPDNGFVGDITGKNPGYSIDPEPLIGIINEYLPGKAIDLTNASFDELRKTLSNKIPIVVWVTCDFKTPEKNTHWNCNGETIDATFSQHAVLLTGYDEKKLFYNDPHSNTKDKSVSKKTFLKIWKTMGNKALSYKS